MNYPVFATLAFQSGFSLHRIVENLPTDPPSIFVLALLAVATVGIIWTSRGGGGPS